MQDGSHVGEDPHTNPEAPRFQKSDALSVQMTGLGYEYVRCRAAGDDATVYVHQLVAITAGADPRDVFSPDFDVHHENHIPWDNRPGNLDLEHSKPHRRGHLDGRTPQGVQS
jgi:hypothetical protein